MLLKRQRRPVLAGYILSEMAQTTQKSAELCPKIFGKFVSTLEPVTYVRSCAQRLTHSIAILAMTDNLVDFQTVHISIRVQHSAHVIVFRNSQPISHQNALKPSETKLADLTDKVLHGGVPPYISPLVADLPWSTIASFCWLWPSCSATSQTVDRPAFPAAAAKVLNSLLHSVTAADLLWPSGIIIKHYLFQKSCPNVILWLLILWHLSGPSSG